MKVCWTLYVESAFALIAVLINFHDNESDSKRVLYVMAAGFWPGRRDGVIGDGEFILFIFFSFLYFSIWKLSLLTLGFNLLRLVVLEYHCKQ